MEGNHENTNFFFVSFEWISEFTQKYLNEKYHIQKDSETAKKIYKKILKKKKKYMI